MTKDKKPNRQDVKAAIMSSVEFPINPADVENIADAVMRLIDDRASGRN